ncbi:hypothetical protein G6F43_009674 [Rhizopus delemar]|nr:hypothetical protein G6F43_009674 [Rhizopus delemar]
MNNIFVVIASSYAYKRKNFLDFQCIFENLDAPQLFLTFTCDDKSEDFKGILSDGIRFPWEDPVLFSLHFKRKWLKVFTDYICKHFARQIGGIKEHIWVMEIQDRGSPHIYMVLWTNKSVQELIEMNIIHAWFPEDSSSNGPIMHDLVNRLQLHKSTAREVTSPRNAVLDIPNHTFQSPFSTLNTVVLINEMLAMYVNNYSPYPLDDFRTSMDVQYNGGPQAGRYLAKYLAKDD